MLQSQAGSQWDLNRERATIESIFAKVFDSLPSKSTMSICRLDTLNICLFSLSVFLSAFHLPNEPQAFPGEYQKDFSGSFGVAPTGGFI